MPAPLTPMDAMRPIDFMDALHRLHALIDTDVDVTINADGRFFGGAFSGSLDRVETVPPDDTAIKIVLENAQGIYLDPADTDAFAGPVEGNQAPILEFRLAFGITVAIEPSDS